MDGDAIFELACPYCQGNFRIGALQIFSKIDWRLQDGSIYGGSRVPALPVGCPHCDAEIKVTMAVRVVTPAQVNSSTDRLVGQREFRMVNEDQPDGIVECPDHGLQRAEDHGSGLVVCSECNRQAAGRIVEAVRRSMDAPTEPEAWMCAECGERRVAEADALCLACANSRSVVDGQDGTRRIPDPA